MEIVEGNARRMSMSALIRQQVEEQSELCDFTIKHGLWSKRYHACVVYASPFVQAMMRNNFNEKTKGFLELPFGTPESIDMAIMSLYGKCPQLSMDNVSSLIDLAEFLMIPDLKTFCVNWIYTKNNVNEKNVENLLHLATIYDFEIPKLTKYIRQHLPELLGGNHLLTITADSLENMLTDATLSYVYADVWFEFVMRWVEHCPKHRKPKLDKLVTCIELTEVTAGLIEKAKRDTNFEDLQTVFSNEPETVVKLQNVLFFHKNFNYGDFWVFDLAKERWFSLEISTRSRFEKSFAFTPNETSLCLVKSSRDQIRIRLQDFEADKFTYTFIPRSIYFETSLNQWMQNPIYISNKTCFVVFDPNVGTCSVKKYIIRKPTLFIGAVSESNDETTLTPIISLNIKFGVQLVVNQTQIALFSKEHTFFCIYDEHSCKIEKINVKPQKDDQVSPFKNGFVIYDQEKIRYIQLRTDSCFKWKCSVYETCLFDKRSISTIRVVGNKWFRFQMKGFSKHSLDYTLDELGRVNLNDVKWKQIPLPDHHVDASIIENIHEIKIPRSKLKCNVACPHCERIKDERFEAAYTYDSLTYSEAEAGDLWDDSDDYDGFYYDESYDGYYNCID